MRHIWVQVFEAWAVTRLLRSPTFHRAVGSVHKGIRRVIHGKPMEEMGGTNIDRPSFLNHFADEVKRQIRDGTRDQKRL
ncbi:hypothetical protein P152DRAFT_474858 [Eremomyces bilateralis CBS 781.70]|uniref:Uncharacterized protein n=1 Tax=Eremomyces bilateralis CBS 781.70 TaxID=1392243 RepID=A0A6G1FZZ8_9PEZI|nr:uncharacterized protein P152DRAFT_474858 [Eremomyces bilateralis CBS 781.70]KAF1811251.1 hypothetical protein P152DRAFT_474858 [Eremomyces bilateralis CBS 781.70]